MKSPATFVEWKSVAVEMPDTDTTVLVHSTTANEPVWLGFWDSEHQCWREVSAEIVENVTHWAHLPEPPHAN